jgi:hypothetical protein
MIAPAPPDGLIDHLRRFDPMLRLRWATHQAKWLIEIQLPPRSPALRAERPSPLGTSPRALDWWDGWKDGYLYVTALAHPITYPWEFIAAHLTHLTLNAHLAKDALMGRLDEAERLEEVSVDRAWDVVNEAGAKTLYDDMAWESGRRVSMNDAGRPAKEEAREGYVVMDRRVTA